MFSVPITVKILTISTLSQFLPWLVLPHGKEEIKSTLTCPHKSAHWLFYIWKMQFSRGEEPPEDLSPVPSFMKRDFSSSTSGHTVQ